MGYMGTSKNGIQMILNLKYNNIISQADKIHENIYVPAIHKIPLIDETVGDDAKIMRGVPMK
jgi:hypothetical protein